MKKVKIAVIGAGNHARSQHYPALSFIPEINLCAACDLDSEKLAQVKKDFNILNIYSDYRKMIAKEKPDGILIIMPPMPLTKVALDCLNLKQNIMIEKPPGCSVSEASQILRKAETNNLKVMVSVNRRFIPLIRKLKDLVADHGFVHCSATYNKAGFFKGNWSWPCPLPVADAIHLIDLVSFFGGEVKEVFGATNQLNADYVNSCTATVIFESGGFASINNHQCVGTRMQLFELHGLNMSAYLNLSDTFDPKYELWIKNEKVTLDLEQPELPQYVNIDNYYENLHFAKWLMDEEKPVASLQDVIKSVELAEKIANSQI